MSTPTGRKLGRPRTRSVAEQRALVLAAARAVFAANGQHGASIEQIAKQAGVPRQAVYEQFGDKAGLFTATVADTEELVLRAIGTPATEPDMRARVHAHHATLFAFVAEHPDALPLLREAERGGDPALSRLRTALAAAYAEAGEPRWRALGIEPGRLNTVLYALHIAMAEAAVHLPSDQSPEPDALIELLTEFTIGGLTHLYVNAPGLLDKLR